MHRASARSFFLNKRKLPIRKSTNIVDSVPGGRLVAKYAALGDVMKNVNLINLIACVGIGEKLATATGVAFSRESSGIDFREFAANAFSEEQGMAWRRSFELLGTECSHLGLMASAKTCAKIVELASQDARYGDMARLNEELRIRLQDELGSVLCFSVALGRQELVKNDDLFGANVAKAFPTASFDIKEAGQCMAFERWVAAVFHLMRVAEIATVTIGERIGYSSHKKGFGEVLKYMDSQLSIARSDYARASELFKGDIEFLSDVSAQMHSVNQAWRQRVSHLDKKYSEEEAMRIWDATKGLMQSLATKVTEGTEDST